MDSKFACPTAATSSIAMDSRALIRFGVADVTVNAAAVESATALLAFAAAVSAVVIVALA